MSTVYDYVCYIGSYFNPLAYSNPFGSTSSSVNSIDYKKCDEKDLVEETRNCPKPMVVNKQYIIDKLHLIEALEKMENKRKNNCK